jgi:phosphoglucomutase
VRECMDHGERVARESQADLVIATDPDADRIGGLACTSPDGVGDYRFINGNEIAALLTHFKLSQLSRQGSLPKSPIVISTEVTTGQIGRIGRHFGAQVIDDLLVGFKYHADVLWQLESTGQYGDVRGTPDDFIIGTEESHGILATAALRDKDSACAALLLAEAALWQKRQSRTLIDSIDDLNRQFGYFRNEVLNIVMTGIEGKQDMARMLDTLRASPPKEIGGLIVSRFEDLRDENGRFGPYKGDTDRAARNFLIFRMSGPGLAAKVSLRPSGTEPKAKAYLEVCSEPRGAGVTDAVWKEACAAIDWQIQKLATAFLQIALATVGRTAAPGADTLTR